MQAMGVREEVPKEATAARGEAVVLSALVRGSPCPAVQVARSVEMVMEARAARAATAPYLPMSLDAPLGDWVAPRQVVMEVPVERLSAVPLQELPSSTAQIWKHPRPVYRSASLADRRWEAQAEPAAMQRAATAVLAGPGVSACWNWRR